MPFHTFAPRSLKYNYCAHHPLQRPETINQLIKKGGGTVPFEALATLLKDYHDFYDSYDLL